jgi:hypothetical protein
LTLLRGDLLQVVDSLAQPRHQIVVDGAREVDQDAAGPGDGLGGVVAVVVVDGLVDVGERALEPIGAALRDQGAAVAGPAARGEHGGGDAEHGGEHEGERGAHPH